MPVNPSDVLENTFRLVNHCFMYSHIPYWLCFGGLYGLVRENGVIPDHDLDICTYYGQEWKKLRKILETRGYTMTRAMLNDAEPDKCVYMAFNHPKFLHLCITFWYESHGIRWYCHDNHFTVHGEGVPTIGYYFKGMPAELVNDESLFRMAEWPGICQSTMVRVPRFPGAFLDHMYEDWGYKRQKYNIDKKHTVLPEKMKSYHKGGAISPYMVHLNSMKDFNNEKIMTAKMEEGRRNYNIHLKNTKKM